jgi:positive phototaxis protein PixI
MTQNTTLTRLQELLPQLFEPSIIIGDLYLRFQLTPEIPALLPMTRVQEALLVPAAAISPLPNLPAFMIGMMNARDRVFCVVDLAQLLGLPSMTMNPRDYQVVIIQLPGTEPESIDSFIGSSKPSLGLAVRQIKGVARFEKENLISSPHHAPKCLEPYVLGCFSEANEQILVLDPVSIVIAPSKIDR